MNNSEIDEPQLKAQITRDGNQQVVDATIAIRSSDQWLVAEVTSNQPQRRVPHLLPIVGSSKRVCGRTDDEALLMEIVSLNTDRTSLLNAWRQAGWEIQHTAWGNDDSFSFLCAKSGQVVYAWSQQHKQITTLLLSRTRDIAKQPAASHFGNRS